MGAALFFGNLLRGLTGLTGFRTKHGKPLTNNFADPFKSSTTEGREGNEEGGESPRRGEKGRKKHSRKFLDRRQKDKAGCHLNLLPPP
jgi:hypothetical protein